MTFIVTLKQQKFKNSFQAPLILSLSHQNLCFYPVVAYLIFGETQYRC